MNTRLMTEKRPYWVIVTLALVLLSACNASACAGAGCPPRLNEVTSFGLGHDYSGGKLTDSAAVFKPTDDIHAAGLANIAINPTTIKAVWTMVDADGGKAQNLMIMDKNVVWDKDPASGVEVNFDLQSTNAAGFPDGKYKVDIFLNTDLAKTVEFTIAS